MPLARKTAPYRPLPSSSRMARSACSVNCRGVSALQLSNGAAGCSWQCSCPWQCSCSCSCSSCSWPQPGCASPPSSSRASASANAARSSSACRICRPASASHGVVTIVARPLSCRSRRTTSSSRRSGSSCVRLHTSSAACAIWSSYQVENSSRYVWHRVASTTVAAPVRRSGSPRASSARTAARMSESLPTPDGSTRMRSGRYVRCASSSASVNAPDSEQQMQPASSSEMASPVSRKKPPSMPACPNSFSSSTRRSPR